MSTLPLFPPPVEKNVSGIYLIRCLANGKVYVGQSVDVRRRFATHRQLLRGGSHFNAHLQHAWDKYGQGRFVYRLIEVTQALDEREGYWMGRLHSLSFGFNMLPVVPVFRGAARSHSVLTEAIVVEARDRVKAGQRVADLAREFAVNAGTLHSAVTGVSWCCLLSPPPVPTADGVKLAEMDVVFIRRAIREGSHNTASLAEVFGVTRGTISAAARGAKWTHVSEPIVEIGGKNQKRYKGESVNGSKLSRSDVVDIRNRARGGESISAISKDYECCLTVVWSAAKGKTWAHVTEAAPVVGKSPNSGEFASGSKLTQNQVVEARRRRKAGESIVSIARDYPCKASSLSRAIRGFTWKSVDTIEAPCSPRSLS